MHTLKCSSDPALSWPRESCHWMIRKYLRAKYRDLCKYPNVSPIWGSAIMQTRNYYLWDCSDPRYAGNLRTKSTQYINICNKRQYFPKFNFSCDGGTFPSEVLTSGKEAKILRLFTLGMLVWLRIDQFGIKIFSPNKRNIKKLVNYRGANKSWSQNLKWKYFNISNVSTSDLIRSQWSLTS